MNASIVISGFGEEDLSLGAQAQLLQGENIILHTENCYLSGWLKAKGIAYTSLDALYEEASDFDAHVEKALEKLKEAEKCVYCVMDTSDEAARALVQRAPETRVYGGSAYAGLEIRSRGKCCFLSAMDALTACLSPLDSALIKELDSRLLAGEVKLKLEDVYGEDASVFFRMPQGDIVPLTLDKLDRLKHYDHRCGCLINPQGTPASPDYECLKLISASKEVKDACLDEETLAQKLACVVQSTLAAEKKALFSQRDVFERAADILSEGE